MVEVVYATTDQQLLLEVDVPRGATVEEAIHKSGILSEFPQIELRKNKVGIFSKVVQLSQPLREKDRIEIYRPLIADPKEIRRKRAQQGKKMKKGGG